MYSLTTVYYLLFQYKTQAHAIKAEYRTPNMMSEVLSGLLRKRTMAFAAAMMMQIMRKVLFSYIDFIVVIL